jgi:hypothetical protein
VKRSTKLLFSLLPSLLIIDDVNADWFCHEPTLDPNEVVISITFDTSCSAGGTVGTYTRYTTESIDSVSLNYLNEKAVCAGWPTPAGYTIARRISGASCSSGKGGNYPALNTEMLMLNRNPTSGGKVYALGVGQLVSGSAVMADPDGDQLTYTNSTGHQGTFELDEVTGYFTYTPPASFEGKTDITIIATDGKGGEGRFYLTFEVGNQATENRPPVVPGISIMVASGTSTKFPLAILGATDPDGDPLTYQVLNLARTAHGYVSFLEGTGDRSTYKYTPDAGYIGPDNFRVIVTDTHAASTEGAIRIDVVGPDVDGDGMPASFEHLWGFNPWDASDGPKDLDSDGLSNLGEYQAGTKPNVADSDGDGMPDGYEKYRPPLNPLLSSDATMDADGDSYSNLDEYRAGTDPLNAQIYPGHNPVAWLIPVWSLLLH